MSILKAIILGIIQGLAEFLPVSSSGHLAIAKVVFQFDTDTGLLFDVLLHLGTLAAIFAVFWKDIRELIMEGFAIIGCVCVNGARLVANIFSKKKKAYEKVITSPYKRFVLMILIATVPTGIIGVLASDFITWASAGILIPGIMLLVTGILLFISDVVIAKNIKTGRTRYQEGDAPYYKSGIIGITQGIATLPGLSRSGTTITAGLLCGFDQSFAIRYSFIMSIPAVLGAAVLELKDVTEMAVSGTEWAAYLLGMLTAAVVGYFSIKTMLVIIKGKRFKYFACYCILAGILTLGYLIFGN